MTIHSIILAAGQGTRMRSDQPKVLHQLLGQPIAYYAVQAASLATGSRPLMVIGHGADSVRQAFHEGVDFVVQEPQRGTGDAVRQAKPYLEGKSDYILVTYADMPLITVATLNRLISAHQKQSGPISLITVVDREARGFGRIIRKENGSVQAIVEEAQATPEQLAIHELNASIYCFSSPWLWDAIEQIPLSPKGEYYLTDLVEIAVKSDQEVQAIVLDDNTETIGINTRVHLAEAAAILQARINENLMLSGVTIVDPLRTYIEPEVAIGRDTVIWPNSYLRGKSEIGEGCTIGPDSIIDSTTVGDNCSILASVLEHAIVEDEVSIGPFGHLRKGAHLGKGVHMGNFGEVKNSYLGPGVKMGHFSYLGDATLEADVNIGAGTITCNFDGKNKNPTDIGAGAFIGSDTMLVAPVRIGKGARTGAGAVVTKDVPDHTLAVGVPARVIRKLEKRD